MKRHILHLFLVYSILQLGIAWDVVHAIKSHKTDAKDAVQDFASFTISAITASQCSLQVYWSCEFCPASFDGFRISWQQTGSQDKESVLVSHRSNNHNIEGLNSDQNFTVWVALVFGNEEYSSDPVEKSTGKGEPVVVTGVNAVQVSDSVINVEWKKTSNPCPLYGYLVTWNGTSKWDSTLKIEGSKEFDGENTNVNVDYLKPFSVYDFYVSEITTDGIIGNPSEPSRAETKEGAVCPPEPVTSLTFDSYSAQVNWSFPDSPNGVILGYHVSCQILPDETDDCDVLVNDPEILTANATKLKACGDYTFTVQAINSYGFGEPGTHFSRTDSEPPPNFTQLYLVNKTSTSVVLTWDSLMTNCRVLKYDLHGEEVVLWADGTDSFDIAISGEHDSFILENLTPYSFYNISFDATTEGGRCTTPYLEEFETLEDVAEAPSFLNSSTIDSSTVLLKWGPSTAINGELLGYLISYRKQEELLNDYSITTNEIALSYVISGLDACSDYFFTVQAINGVGSGDKATTESRTDGEDPPPIGDVEVTAVNQTNVTITFEPPTTTCDILLYEVVGMGLTLWNDEVIEYNTTLEGGSKIYVLQNLTPYTMYTFQITASTEGGTTSEERFNAETEKSVPSAPSNLALVDESLSENAFKVTWEKPASENGNMVQFGIYLYHGAEIIQENTVTYNEENSEFSYMFTQLETKTSYKVSVAAENDVGVSTTTDLQVTTL